MVPWMVLSFACDAVLEKVGFNQSAAVVVSAAQPVVTQGFIQTLSVVHGAGTPVKAGSRVRAHIRIESGDSLILDTLDNGLPFEFVVGSGQVPGFLSSGVVGLQPHGKRTFLVPAAHAGGTTGIAPLLPPGREIKVTVEVLSVQSPA